MNLNNSTNVSWLFGTKGTPRDTYGYIKTKKFKIDNIHCVRGFLYILGDPGPWCAVPTHLQVPLLNAACTTFLKPFLNKKSTTQKVVCTAWTVKFVFHALGFSWWTCQQDFPRTWRERRRWAIHWWICQGLSGRRWTHDVHCALFTAAMVFNSFQKKF